MAYTLSMRLVSFLASIAITSAALLAACTQPATTSTTVTTRETSPTMSLEQLSDQLRAHGSQLYARNCQVCHGDREGRGGMGTAPPHNQTGHTWHHPDAQLKEWILNGRVGFSQMPAFKGTLTVQDVDALLAFIKTWWTKEQYQNQAEISE
jgi:mono/diheme cytochrome c family protein